MADKIMFRNIYYSPKSNKITLWWNVNDKARKDVFEYKHEYYVATDEPTEYKDLYGRFMKKELVDRVSDVPEHIPNGIFHIPNK